MSGVVAKFYVQQVEKFENQPSAARVTLGAVCRGVENASWASATPYGNVVLGTLNEAAADYFEEHEEYLVTFQKVTKPKPGDGHTAKDVRDKWGNVLCEVCGAFKSLKEGVERKYDPSQFGSTNPPEDWTWGPHDEMYGGKSE